MSSAITRPATAEHAKRALGRLLFPTAADQKRMLAACRQQQAGEERMKAAIIAAASAPRLGMPTADEMLAIARQPSAATRILEASARARQIAAGGADRQEAPYRITEMCR